MSLQVVANITGGSHFSSTFTLESKRYIHCAVVVIFCKYVFFKLNEIHLFNKALLNRLNKNCKLPDRKPTLNEIVEISEFNFLYRFSSIKSVEHAS